MDGGCAGSCPAWGFAVFPPSAENVLFYYILFSMFVFFEVV